MSARRFRRSRAAAPTWLVAAAIAAGVGWAWWRSARLVPAPTPPLTTIGTNSQPPAEPAAAAAAPVVITNPPPGAWATSLAVVVTSPAMPPRWAPLTNGPPGGFSTGVLAAQMALKRRVISPGPLDGVAGIQTRLALRVFQEQAGLPATGLLDDPTRARLQPATLALTQRVVTSSDLGRLLPVSLTWLGKAAQERLDYETALELVAEAAQSSVTLIRRLNPAMEWSGVLPGTAVSVPEIAYLPPRARAAYLSISLEQKSLQVFDETDALLAHFPVSIARQVEKRPLGELRVVKVASNPVYLFDPAMSPESPEAGTVDRRLTLPPGPNNPVGVAWIGLDRPGYGIHGTPSPEQVGRTESHGCFRLANWDAEYLLLLVRTDLPVLVEE